jgi:transcriptional regulator NrdR family protein
MTQKAIDIVKRGGRRPTEAFEEKKLRASILAACLSAGTPVGHAEVLTQTVTNAVLDWLETRPEVTSDDLRRTAARHLTTHHPDAAYLYEQHTIIL